MSDSTPRLGLPDLPDTPELYADTVADAFARLDAFTDLCLKGVFVNTPPSSPADGDAYIVGGSPSGAWSGYPYKIASCRDGAWTMLAPFDGLRAFVPATGALLVYGGGVWTDWNALLSGAESSIASAATCDIGGAGTLVLAVTGSTTITSFGTVANRLRLLRFAGALTLTHNATSLILPGGADIVTAAGDTAMFSSDAAGNWRCRHYSRADGRMVNMAAPVFTGTLTAAAANFSGAVSLNAAAPLLSLAPASYAGSYKTQLGALSDATGILVFGNSAHNEIRAGATAAGGHLDIFTNNTAAIGTAGDGIRAARFAADGGLLVGTTTNGGWTAAAKMAVENGGPGLGLYNNGSTGWALSARVDNSAVAFAQFYYNGSTGVGSITTNGTATAYNTSSDARLKDNIRDAGDAGAILDALKVRQWEWKANGAHEAFGFVAQEEQGVYAAAVTPGDDGDDGDAITRQWSRDDSKLVPLLVKEIQSLRARLAALEAAP
ncbi:MAG: DUF2793 domain-containing protein [Alphaproteobacteria bacterium]|nr:DUF2793 domain-containing protein [Alphaproteobacteria bacterium]